MAASRTLETRELLATLRLSCANDRLLTFLALERELSERLGRPVDLVQKEAVQRRIGRAIRAEAIPV